MKGAAVRPDELDLRRVLRNGDTVESDFHNFREGDHEDAPYCARARGAHADAQREELNDAQSGDVT